jgi:uncharacterized protein YjiS (DUF1127 family)
MAVVNLYAPAAVRPNLGARIADSFRAFVRGVALGRMVRVLNEMSDAQLAKIGVKREDIPAYARKLVAEN